MILAYEYNYQNELVRPIEVFERDDEGNYVIPNQCTTIAPPNNPSFYKAAFDVEKQQWYESATQEYINSLKTKPKPNDLEILKEQNAFLTKQMAQILRDIKGLKTL
ncbi:hypothetical protein [Bacillus pumilus]|uniref:hypothetical protein n=1 Tax=Bacillus pumilus TaxID=1408 RepID=UPI003339A9F4